MLHPTQELEPPADPARFRPSLDERACATVRLGREVSDMAEALFPLEGPDADIVARTLRRLADRNPFNLADDMTLRALRAILEAELGRRARGLRASLHS